jgi:hypothetical protein
LVSGAPDFGSGDEIAGFSLSLLLDVSVDTTFLSTDG